LLFSRGHTNLTLAIWAEVTVDRKGRVLLALDEVRSLNSFQFDSGDALDQKGSSLFGSASLILTLITTIVVSIGWGDTQVPLYWIALGVASLLYLIMTVVFLVNIGPRKYKTPLVADRDVIGREILDREGEEPILALVGGYIDAIEHNQDVNDAKKVAVWVMLVLLPLIVGALIAVGIVAR
jgi:hypothetical protein